ncbi:MAG TPA: hypothetical protein DCF68_02745 [Cyanothece sp. UBA12306]|nr:hypothetical protein [Cyanothece sp. UBA12306]
MNKSKVNLKNRLVKLRRKRVLKILLLMGFGLILSSLIFNILVKLPINSLKPIDGILVLGGSIKREIYAAQIAGQFPKTPIIISQGSQDPCILLIFNHYQAPLSRVWLEKCANSTFENFFFSVPLLHKLGVHKVKLITSGSHLPRAKWMAQIHLGVRGIAVEVDTVSETGVPGNQESRLKTQLDVTRSLIWSVFSPLLMPSCSEVISLDKVNLSDWYQEGFKCERQGRIF